MNDLSSCRIRYPLECISFHIRYVTNQLQMYETFWLQITYIFLNKWPSNTYSGKMAVASISTRYSGLMRAFTSIIELQGLMFLKNSPFALPYSCQSEISVTNMRILTTSSNPAPACCNTLSIFCRMNFV